MAKNLDVLNGIADFLTTALQPYQPNMPPQFPNNGAMAGTIPNTVIGPGRPMQYHVMTTLEQGGSQIGMYFGKVSKPLPYLANGIYQAPAGQTSGSVTNIYQETGRELRQIVIEVWSYKPEDRDAISALVRAALSDVTRLNMPDGTVALLRWANENEHDEEQMDSVWITQEFYMADITRTLLIGSAQDLGTGYIVTEVDTYVQPEDDQGAPVGPQVEVVVPNPSGDPNGT